MSNIPLREIGSVIRLYIETGARTYDAQENGHTENRYQSEREENADEQN
jgi:hypothetical protein